ncbi:hypothetical protein [Janthinobacterium sp. LB3P112]|uniref:hypothetical protein n=1 Tax=Janthinobacterium sp. LB3P112 TaxID=3424196 RepID=UPI003F204224
MLQKDFTVFVSDSAGNGLLDPDIPLTVSYPRNVGSWVDVVLTVRGTVSGTEASATAALRLPTLASDFSANRVDPPGRISPYGSGPCDSPD